MMGPLAWRRLLSTCLAPIVSRRGSARLVILGLTLSCAVPVAVSSPTPWTSRPQPANTDFSRLESEVLAALNRARADPQGTAAGIDALVRYYNGKLLTRPGQPVPIQTVEGAAAAREAAAAVRSQSALTALTLNADLTRAARDHVQDQGRTGNVGHTGADGSTVTTRVSRYGTWQKSISENIAYSTAASGTDVVQDLLIDDGVSDRGHRRNIYDPSARIAGIACGPHPRYGGMCVIVQVGGFIPK
jgi:uncharacterized protein YkwD